MSYREKPVTKKDVQSRFPMLENIDQINSKQLFVARVKRTQILVSYTTIVAINSTMQWHVTNKVYSRTTTRQINSFMRGRQAVTLEHEAFMRELNYILFEQL